MTKDNKKIVARLLLVSLLTGGVVFEENYNKKNTKINESFTEVVDTFNTDTKLDEAVDKNLASYKDMTVIESLDTLEEDIEIVNLLDRVNLNNKQNIDLSEEDYAFGDSLTKEDVIILLQVIESEKEKNINKKAKAKEILNYAKNKREEWIEKNGRKVVLKSLSWTVKSSMAEELGLPVEEIKDIEIPTLKKVKDLDFYLIYGDDKYFVQSQSDSIFNSLYYYYQIDSSSDLQGEEYRVYSDAINAAKVLTMTGIQTENHELGNVRRLKDARKSLKMS